MDSFYFITRQFIDYLEKEDIFQKLLDFYYGNNYTDKNTEVSLDIFIELLKVPDIQVKLNYNSLGKIYENNLPQGERKTLGEFYTPKFVVDYILEAVGYRESENIQNKKIIDISCGSGSFIISAVACLIPTKTDRAIILCPILNSQSFVMRATPSILRYVSPCPA